MASNIKVTVKSATGLKFDVEFSPEITVGDLKKILEAPDKAGFGAELQRLIYSGRILKDNETLASYNVRGLTLVFQTYCPRQHPSQPPSKLSLLYQCKVDLVLFLLRVIWVI